MGVTSNKNTRTPANLPVSDALRIISALTAKDNEFAIADLASNLSDIVRVRAAFASLASALPALESSFEREVQGTIELLKSQIADIEASAQNSKVEVPA